MLMKKYLLLVLTIFVFGSGFASQNLGLSNSIDDQNQRDSSSVNFYEMQKLKLYPNPASTYLFIDYDIIFVKEAKIQIYNSIGAVVYNKIVEDKQDNIKISVADFNNGLYFCSLQIDGKLINTKKLLVNH